MRVNRVAVGLIVGVTAVGAVAWFVNRTHEGLLEERTRDRLRSRAPADAMPSAVGIRVD